MRPMSPTIRSLLLVLLAASRAIAQVPKPSVPDVGSEDGKQDLTDLTLEELMSIDLECSAHVKVAFGF